MKMDNIKTVLVDDEGLARDRLKSLLRDYSYIKIVGEAEDGEQAIEVISDTKPDLVFLDIQMPGCSGIEVAASLSQGKPKVIFCTAYDQYAIDAFELHATDYLLKPVSRARLRKAIDKIKVKTGDEAAVEQTLSHVVPTRFLGKRANRFHVIPIDSVLYFWSEGGLTQMWTKEQFYWMEPALNELEKRLEMGGFYRLSRQALVNLDKVLEVIPLIGGHGQVKLTNKKELSVSRRRMKNLIERLEGR
jgi:DNA-binding LytR/AlgR family response regulator